VSLFTLFMGFGLWTMWGGSVGEKAPGAPAVDTRAQQQMPEGSLPAAPRSQSAPPALTPKVAPPAGVSRGVAPPPAASSPKTDVAESSTRPATTGDLTGAWLVTNRIEQSNIDAFKGLTLGFRLDLDQSGHRVHGNGVKWQENGRVVPARNRTPITLEGTVEGRTVALTFTERGTRRTSHGRFEMELTADGALTGRFSTDAAQSSGSARAMRLQSRTQTPDPSHR
jgi:hypothetical protein